MKIKYIEDINVTDYKETGMFICFPTCDLKCTREPLNCTREPGNDYCCCQNAELLKEPDIDVSYDRILELYSKGDYHKCLICGGLEPFDSPIDLTELYVRFNEKYPNDKFIVYTGYARCELEEMAKNRSVLELVLKILRKPGSNVIIKYGKYIQVLPPRYDKTLGVTLASSNQFAEAY